MVKYKVLVDRVIVTRDGIPLYGFKVKNMLEGLGSGNSKGKGSPDYFLKTQMEYNGTLTKRNHGK